MSHNTSKSFSLFGKKPAVEKKPEEKKPNRSFNSTPTIIAKDLKIEGQLTSTGLVEIEGCIIGNIKGNSVILLPSGSIEGEVEAESFSIKGKFNGTIKAKSVNIGSKARISGTIEYSLLSVEDGASVDAKFKKLTSATTTINIA